MKIISLGSNCEVSFRIMDYTNKPLDSYIFSWTASYDPMTTISALEDLNKLKGSSWTKSPTGMFINDKYNIGFHGKPIKAEISNESVQPKENDNDSIIDELNSRMSHLIEKTEKMFFNNSKENVLFIYKYEVYKQEDKEYKNALTALLSMYNVLETKFKKDDFFLLAIYDDQNLIDDLKQVNIAENILFYNVGFFPNPDSRRAGGNHIGWDEAIYSAINAFKNYKLNRLQKNILPEIAENNYWDIVKSGDAQGNIDFNTKRISCKSEGNCYWGISHNIDKLYIYEGRVLELNLKISDIESDRDDIGYLQIWVNYSNNSKTESVYLANIKPDKFNYQVFYKIPENGEISRCRIVVQAKNGSFKINELKLNISALQ